MRPVSKHVFHYSRPCAYSHFRRAHNENLMRLNGEVKDKIHHDHIAHIVTDNITVDAQHISVSVTAYDRWVER